MSKEHRILEELQILVNIIDDFTKGFDCGDIPCSACPVGPELCLTIHKKEVYQKLSLSSVSRVLVETYWREAVIVILSLGLLGKFFGWW